MCLLIKMWIELKTELRHRNVTVRRAVGVVCRVVYRLMFSRIHRLVRGLVRCSASGWWCRLSLIHVDNWMEKIEVMRSLRNGPVTPSLVCNSTIDLSLSL